MNQKIDQWISERSNVDVVTLDDFDGLDKQKVKMPQELSPLQLLLSPYTFLYQESTASRQGLFIAEGIETVRLLLQQSVTPRYSHLLGDIRIQSVVCKPIVLSESSPLGTAVDAALESLSVSRCFSLLIAEEAVQNRITGYKSSRGAMACGLIPNNRTETWLIKIHLPSCLSVQPQPTTPRRLRLLAIDGVNDTSNLGSMVRTASAFGIHAILLNHTSCDAWYRRAVRVSMGHIFCVPVVRVSDLATTLSSLQEAFQVNSYAAVTNAADLILEQMNPGSIQRSWCCVVGNESSGISPSVIKSCTYRV